MLYFSGYVQLSTTLGYKLRSLIYVRYVKLQWFVRSWWQVRELYFWKLSTPPSSILASITISAMILLDSLHKGTSWKDHVWVLNAMSFSRETFWCWLRKMLLKIFQVREVFSFSSNTPKLKNPSKAPSILINAYVANQRTRWSWRELHRKVRPCFEKLEWRKAWLVRPRSARKREICCLQASAFNDYTIEGMV